MSLIPGVGITRRSQIERKDLETARLGEGFSVSKITVLMPGQNLKKKLMVDNDVSKYSGLIDEASVHCKNDSIF